MLCEGTLVDATIISAPRSTKNNERKRDSEMSSTKKGNHRYHGMKSHIGPDARCGLTHSSVCTSTDVRDDYRRQSMLTQHRRGCFFGFRIYRY